VINPPSGVVTLVFTDIEGSTRLLHDLGDAYVGVLDEHNSRIRKAMNLHGGAEISNDGDGFLFAFDDSSAALAACGAAQTALADGGWPSGRLARVRIGAHIGPVTLVGGDYVGLTVHEASRVCEAASGGQVVVTDAVVDAARGRLPSDMTLQLLGAYRLRDFPEKRRLHQASVAGLSREFPPLRAIAAQRTVLLPAPPSSLVGRDAEVNDVLRLLSGGTRLVTLTGPGGVGKTRLAIEAARRAQLDFAGGVWFVDLASVTDPDGILPAVSRVIGARDAEPSVSRIAGHIGDVPVLLVLDNFEQVTAGAARVAEMLEVCAALSVLATSRERMRLRAEHEIPLDGLAIEGAVELFGALAAANASTVPGEHLGAVEDICRHVSGIPLALELTAPHLRRRSAAQLLDELRASLDPLADEIIDRPDRHRAMRTTIEWSWNLLDDDEQTLATALGATAGSASLDLAAALASAAGVVSTAGEIVPRLVDKSLLQVDGDRVRMLEVIRQFAEERQPDDASVRAHAEWCAGVVAAAAPHLSSEEAVRWLDILDLERDNIRRALERDAGPLLDNITDIVNWWTARGHWVESRSVLIGLLERGIEDDVMRARVMGHCAAAAARIGDVDDARRLADDAFGLAESANAPVDVQGRILNTLGDVARTQGEFETAELLYKDALTTADRAGDKTTASSAASNLGVLTWQSDRRTDARRWWTEALEAADPGDHRIAAILHSDLGLLDLYDGSVEAAEKQFVESLETGRRLDDPLVTGQALLNLGLVAKAKGDEPLARERYLAALEVYERVGDEPYVAAALLHLTFVTDDLAQAREWAERALEVASVCRDAQRTEEARNVLDAIAELEAEAHA
jgi:predicted ATPase/class 3 adenylate cyclase